MKYRITRGYDIIFLRWITAHDLQSRSAQKEEIIRFDNRTGSTQTEVCVEAHDLQSKSAQKGEI